MPRECNEESYDGKEENYEDLDDVVWDRDHSELTASQQRPEWVSQSFWWKCLHQAQLVLTQRRHLDGFEPRPEVQQSITNQSSPQKSRLI